MCPPFCLFLKNEGFSNDDRALFIIFAGLNYLIDMAKKKKAGIVEVVAKCDKPAAISEIENMIFSLRGTQVMIDSDLAMLYGIETRVLNQAVKRNLDRFPDDFMFRLTTNEYKNLKSQIVTSSSRLLKTSELV